jgi:hypothetical protein
MEFDESANRIIEDNAPNLIGVADLHAGCRLGLCPPGGAKLDDGGRYLPSKLQLATWAWWTELWEEWVPAVTRGEPYDVVLLGDALDGNHHNSTTQISHNLQDQALIAEEILAPIVAKARKYYHVRGTEAHVGPSGVEEERLAKALGAVPNDEGQYARYELWKRVGDSNGPLVHAMHHIGTTSSAAYESSALQQALIAEFVEAGRNRIEPPDYVLRAHRHRYLKVQNPTKRSEAAAIVLPGWQLKTPFTYRIAGGQATQPQFGGVIIRQGDEEFYSRFKRWELERPRIEES